MGRPSRRAGLRLVAVAAWIAVVPALGVPLRVVARCLSSGAVMTSMARDHRCCAKKQPTSAALARSCCDPVRTVAPLVARQAAGAVPSAFVLGLAAEPVPGPPLEPVAAPAVSLALGRPPPVGPPLYQQHSAYLI